ncbi:AMP-binding protein, partial [Rhodococcus erythropolis]|nr:AMP-binding protein [Rhodococcus erythropolis]
TTRLFELFVNEGWPCLARVREVWTGGEEMPAEVFERAIAMCPTQVVHVYGPTETTTFATYYRAESFSGNEVPIGRP